MKVTLYMAISVNGYIAKLNDNTEWVCESDWDELQKKLKESDAVIMGRRTYEISGEDFPYGECLNVVFTRNPNLAKEQNNTLFTNKNPAEVLNVLERQRKENILIIGGGEINRLFLKSGLVDEIILSVHPILLGDGVKFSANGLYESELKLLGVNKLDQDLVQLRYKVR